MKSKDFIEVVVLSIIAQKDTYGYELSKRINQLDTDYLKLGEGTLYPCLRRLESKGYICSYMQQTESRERKYYSISLEGSRYLSEKIQERESENRIISVLNRSGLNYGYE